MKPPLSLVLALVIAVTALVPGAQIVQAQDVAPAAPDASPVVNIGHFAPFGATPADTSVSVFVNGTVVFTDFVYSGMAPNLTLLAGTYTVEIVPTGTVTPAISGSVTIADDTRYDVYAIGGANGYTPTLGVTVIRTTVPPGKALITIGHVAPFDSDIDLTAVNVCTDEGTPVLSDVKYGYIAADLLLDPGVYDLKVVPAAAGCGAAALDLPAIRLVDGKYYDVYVIGTNTITYPLAVTSFTGLDFPQPPPSCFTLTLAHTGQGGNPTATPGESAACPANGQYLAGATIDLSAAPAAGWQVTGWTGTANNASTATTNTLTMPAANHTVSVTYGQKPSLPPGADPYELDDTCAQARPIRTDGTPQTRTFHRNGDQDWLVFPAQVGVTYVIETWRQPGSAADVELRTYESCTEAPVATHDPVFSPDVRLSVKATKTGPLMLQLENKHSDVAAVQVGYLVSVRQRDGRDSAGALIIVAGRQQIGDSAQQNITYVANRVYQVFSKYGYTNDRILYLNHDTSQPGVDEPATLDALGTALTSWALSRVDSARPLNLYLVDHGGRDRFYVDLPNKQVLTPSMLDDWLSAVERAAPGVKINVFIEACLSGSFIHGIDAEQIAGVGRLVVTAANATNDAYLADDGKGARFSDVFLDRLGAGKNVLFSFLEASEAAAAKNAFQVAWIDADGDGVPKEPADYDIAAQRSFGHPGTLSENWPPYITAAQGSAVTVAGRGVLTATVLDDARVRRVWVDVYPPGYTPPASVNGELVREIVPGAVLRSVGDDQFAVEYTGFDDPGTYRVVVHAEDEDGSEAQPVVLFIDAGRQLFLPVVLR